MTVSYAEVRGFIWISEGWARYGVTKHMWITANDGFLCRGQGFYMNQWRLSKIWSHETYVDHSKWRFYMNQWRLSKIWSHETYVDHSQWRFLMQRSGVLYESVKVEQDMESRNICGSQPMTVSYAEVRGLIWISEGWARYGVTKHMWIIANDGFLWRNLPEVVCRMPPNLINLV